MVGIRTQHRLRALTVDKARTPGIYADGGGLNLIITNAGVKRWELRITVGRRRRQLGLGPYPNVSLENARGKAAQIRTAAREGHVGPEIKRPKTTVPIRGFVTFREAFEGYFEMKEQLLTNDKHKAQWRSTMESYVFPTIGRRPVAEVTAAEVIDILKPVWNKKRETAKRVLQRMRAVFEAAIVRGERDKAAPTTGVATVLGSRNRQPAHHAAMPYSEVPAFVERLRGMQGRAATRLAFEFLILTATRAGEVRLSTWREINFDAELWTIPAGRMKARIEHVVPLVPRTLAILCDARAVYRDSELIFPGAKPRLPLSDMTLTKVLRDAGLDGKATAHGFRSSFKDWCAEVAKARDEVSEAALAHRIPDKVRAAYLRTQFLEERRNLMKDWASYVEQTRRVGHRTGSAERALARSKRRLRARLSIRSLGSSA
jgi:integrase